VVSSAIEESDDQESRACWLDVPSARAEKAMIRRKRWGEKGRGEEGDVLVYVTKEEDLWLRAGRHDCHLLPVV